MRQWYIVNDLGEYEGRAKTFEDAYYKIMRRLEHQPYKALYIINEQQYEDLNVDGWCEGGLYVTKDGMDDAVEIESYEHYLADEIDAYKRSERA